MQTLNKTQYHCAELRRSVPLIQRVEWVSGIGQDDAEPVVLAEACALASRCPKGGLLVFSAISDGTQS